MTKNSEKSRAPQKIVRPTIFRNRRKIAIFAAACKPGHKWMIETKLQASQGLSGAKRHPQSLYLPEYFCVGSKHQYPTARTDDFGKVVEV